MSMIDIHKEARASEKALYHTFLTNYKKNSNIVYGFVEGLDDPTYYQRIENLIPHDWRLKLYKSGNKDKVLQIHNNMDWTRFHSKRICFFIDRDLSEFIDDVGEIDGNVYVTDKYSIENDFVNCEMLEKLLSEIMRINIAEMSRDEQEKLHMIFDDNFELFKSTMVPVMAQIILWKRNKKRPLLDNIDPSDFFYFKNADMYIKEEFEKENDRIIHISKCCNIEPDVLDSIKDIKIEFCRKQGPKKHIRGKYMLWFMLMCTKEIHKSITYICSKYRKPPKVRTEIGLKNAVVHLAPRARIPESLKLFVENNYLYYINKTDSVSMRA
ncbi:DUF4435 domain-containing protein [Methanohalophilus portucalensis]|nr:DUF4435 domain-containing protein [Methanohalophilus portucalensis]SMH34721.1 Protein of unknown function [Methanohalophilus portucalensis FDF-1]